MNDNKHLELRESHTGHAITYCGQKTGWLSITQDQTNHQNICPVCLENWKAEQARIGQMAVCITPPDNFLTR